MSDSEKKETTERAEPNLRSTILEAIKSNLHAAQTATDVLQLMPPTDMYGKNTTGDMYSKNT